MSGLAFGPRWRAALCALFAALICCRLPNIVLHGRFWAEEGRDFFRAAWELPWDQALLKTQGGYLNLVANGGTLLAHLLVRLRYAPYVTIAIALFFQCCPAILLANSPAPWLRRRWAVLAALLIVATPPVSEEVWLETLHSQLHLALCAGIILATPTGGAPWLRRFRFALLGLGPLCGPAAAMFAPFFALRALADRTPERWAQMAALALGSALQVGLFYSSDPNRGGNVGPGLLVAIMLVRHLAIPLLGHDGAMWEGDRLRAVFDAGRTPWPTVYASAAIFGVWTLTTLRRWREAPAWLLIPGLCVAAVSYWKAAFGGTTLLVVDFGMRYSFAPQALLGLSLLALAATRRGAVGIVAALGAAWIIGVGAHEYFTPSAPIFASGPDWAEEVARFRADPRHHPAVWPQGWAIDLPPPMR